MNFFKDHKILTLLGAFVVAVIIFGISAVIYVNGVRDEGIRKEADLNATYKASMAELSAFTQKAEESLGVADMGSDKAKEILVEAVKGRYDGNMEPGTGGSMFSALTEAYPDLTATTDSYAKVQTIVESGRDSFKNKQNIMSSRIADYATWKKSGVFKNQVVSMLGFPSDDLKVTIGGNIYRGQEALDKMDQIIMSTDAIGSFESGVSDPLFETDK